MHIYVYIYVSIHRDIDILPKQFSYIWHLTADIFYANGYIVYNMQHNIIQHILHITYCKEMRDNDYHKIFKSGWKGITQEDRKSVV